MKSGMYANYFNRESLYIQMKRKTKITIFFSAASELLKAAKDQCKVLLLA